MKSILYSLCSLLFLSLLGSCKQDKKETERTGEIKTEETMEKSETIKLLVGTYTNKESEGIYTVDFDQVTGKLRNKQLVASTSNPSFLKISKDGKRVFAVNENDPGTVTSFKWDEKGTQLITIDQQPSAGAHPCFLELNEAEDKLAVANYSSGTVSVFGVGPNGELAAGPQLREHQGSGPVMPNQESAHAHCSLFSKGQDLLYAVDLGADKVFSYHIDGQGKLGAQKLALSLTPGDGPRHMVFHPTEEWAFVITELSSTVVSVKVDPETGSLTKIDQQSTLPEGFKGENACADIHISEDGKFLYASNRGHNSIAVFSVGDNGKLQLMGTTATAGDWPRNFTLSPDGKFLLVAVQNSDSITVFKLDGQTGMPVYTGNQIELSMPVCLVFEGQ
ncbi:MAG: lactonase family protein [Sediminicola sp.]